MSSSPFLIPSIDQKYSCNRICFLSDSISNRPFSPPHPIQNPFLSISLSASPPYLSSPPQPVILSLVLPSLPPSPLTLIVLPSPLPTTPNFPPPTPSLPHSTCSLPLIFPQPFSAYPLPTPPQTPSPANP